MTDRHAQHTTAEWLERLDAADTREARAKVWRDQGLAGVDRPPERKP